MAEKISFGSMLSPDFEFESDSISNCVCLLSSSLTGDEIAIDQLTATTYSECLLRIGFEPSDTGSMTTADDKTFMCRMELPDLTLVPYGTPIYYTHDGELIAKLHVKSVNRTGISYFDVTAISAIGLLDSKMHYGGVYTGETFSDIAAEIIGNTFEYSIDADVSGLNVFGWLPYATCRAALHQLLFAGGVNAVKDADGNVLFKYLDNAATAEIPDNRIFIGNSSVEYKTQAKRAEITEHTFSALNSDQAKTLFDNTDGSGAVSNALVTFGDDPCHDLTMTEGLTVLESGVNYAIVSGTGILTGKVYTHVRKITAAGEASASEDQTVRVTDFTLVSPANSGNVAKRVLSYYSSARTVKADIIAGTERPGDNVDFNNPYEEPENAYIESMELTASSFLRAACEFTCDYTPTGFGNDYNDSVVISEPGSWSVPEGIKKIRAILIGGAQGGASGLKGTDGTTSESGDGGEAGLPGAGGKILDVTLDVYPGQTFSVAIGTGGVGGEFSESASVPGNPGTDTTFGALSSSSGTSVGNGFLNIFTGDRYGYTGVVGINGGRGSSDDADGDSIEYGGVTYVPGARGAEITSHDVTAYGGYGGGAAAGQNGGDGDDGGVWYGSNFGSVGYWPEGGIGGRGGDAVEAENASVYGVGGTGGNGGGGGGQGYKNDVFTIGGAGGDGNNGGDGAPGCAIIYY